MDAAQAKIQTGESIIGYTFSDKHLLWQAIQTSGIGAVPKNNRLAVFGGTALNKLLCRLWFQLNLSTGEFASLVLANLSFVYRRLDDDQKCGPELKSRKRWVRAWS